MKIKDLTLGQLIEICENHNKHCTKCPLQDSELHCFYICDASVTDKERIHNALEEVLPDDIR